MFKKPLEEVVLITGGCGRIGSALAEKLLLSGYKVLIGDINKKNLIKRKMNNNFMIFLKHLNYKIMNIFLLLDKIRKKLYLNKLYKN